MTEATITTPQRSAPAPREVRLPPTPPVPRLIQGLGFTASRKWTVAQIVRRYGDVFTLQLPVFGRTVIVADPALAKELFMANTEDVGNIQPNLSRVLGSGSVFALDGTDHRQRRRLLTPPFHGKSIRNYEAIFEEETLREAQSWPEGTPFETRDPGRGSRRSVIAKTGRSVPSNR